MVGLIVGKIICWCSTFFRPILDYFDSSFYSFNLVWMDKPFIQLIRSAVWGCCCEFNRCICDRLQTLKHVNQGKLRKSHWTRLPAPQQLVHLFNFEGVDSSQPTSGETESGHIEALAPLSPERSFVVSIVTSAVQTNKPQRTHLEGESCHNWVK